MLIYHPTHDAYHCVFRMLVISEAIPELEVDKARILDFYLLFPSAISTMRLPSNLRGVRKIADAIANPYHDPLNINTTFRELRNIQDAALKCIAASGLIDVDRFSEGYVTRTVESIPIDLQEKIDAFVSERGKVADIILGKISKIELRGANGLKQRSSLMEYRYDVT